MGIETLQSPWLALRTFDSLILSASVYLAPTDSLFSEGRRASIRALSPFFRDRHVISISCIDMEWKHDAMTTSNVGRYQIYSFLGNWTLHPVPCQPMLSSRTEILSPQSPTPSMALLSLSKTTHHPIGQWPFSTSSPLITIPISHGTSAFRAPSSCLHKRTANSCDRAKASPARIGTAVRRALAGRNLYTLSPTAYVTRSSRLQRKRPRCWKR